MIEKIFRTQTLFEQPIVPSEEVQHEFDEKGNKIIEDRRWIEPEGPAPYYKILYSYDVMGNLVMEERERFGSLTYHDRRIFRTNGQIDQKISLDADGSVKERITYFYDASGLLVKMEGGDGALRYTYDKYGNIIELGINGKDSPTKMSFDYQYDSHGNWIKCETADWAKEDGKYIYKSGGVRYRTITYH